MAAEPTCWIVPGARRRTGKLVQIVVSGCSGCPAPLAYSLESAPGRSAGHPRTGILGYSASCAGEGEIRVFGLTGVRREFGTGKAAAMERIANGVGVVRPANGC